MYLKCQLQDWIVTFDGIEQIKQFWLEIKAENSSKQLMQKSLQKIELVQFYMQIELTYVIIKELMQNIMVYSLVDNVVYKNKQKT